MEDGKRLPSEDRLGDRARESPQSMCGLGCLGGLWLHTVEPEIARRRYC